MRAASLLALLLLLCSAPLYANTRKPPTQTALDAITARGKLLAEYDKVAAFSSDAVQATKPAEDKVRRYVAIKEKTGWKVYFGRLDEKKANFLVAYEATATDSSLTKFDVKTNDPPVAVTGLPLNTVKAMETALANFKPEEQRSYNIAALPSDKGQIWVYVYPAQTNSDIWPLGGDTRYLLSANGEKIVSTRRLHKSIIDFPSPPEGTKIAAGYHSAILDNLPEDTDVFYVLTRRPSLQEYIVTQKFVYLIKTDGSIKYQGTREAFVRQGGLPK